MPTVAELYAAHHRLPASQAERAIFLCCLYPPARLLRPLLAVVSPQHFEADLALVHEIAGRTCQREIAAALEEHRCHYLDSGMLRRRLRLRLSTRRLERLACKTIAAGASPLAPRPTPATTPLSAPASSSLD